MKLYLASPFPNKKEVQHWRDRLVAAGHRITHDWTTAEEYATPAAPAEVAVGASPGFIPRNETLMPIDEQQRHAIADLRGVLTADVIWVIAPPTGGTGVWIEMGTAIGLQIAHLAFPTTIPTNPQIVVVSGPSPRSIFTSLFHYEKTHEDAFAWLLALAHTFEPGPLEGVFASRG